MKLIQFRIIGVVKINFYTDMSLIITRVALPGQIFSRISTSLVSLHWVSKDLDGTVTHYFVALFLNIAVLDLQVVLIKFMFTNLPATQSGSQMRQLAAC